MNQKVQQSERFRLWHAHSLLHQVLKQRSDIVYELLSFDSWAEVRSWPVWVYASSTISHLHGESESSSFSTLSVQTGQAACSAQPVPPVLLVLPICVWWKDLLWRGLQSRNGGAGPLWRRISNCYKEEMKGYKSGNGRNWAEGKGKIENKKTGAFT